MNNTTGIERCVAKAAGARLSSGKPETLQRRGTQRPPARRRSASNINAAPKLGARALPGDF
eukprot:9955705-Alexandrium_andersonii.AAC.1